MPGQYDGHFAEVIWKSILFNENFVIDSDVNEIVPNKSPQVQIP